MKGLLVRTISVVLLVASARAQPTPSAPPPETPDTPATLQARIDKVQASTELDEAVRKQIVEHLESALRSLVEAGRHESELAGLERMAAGAPERLAEIESELRSPPSEVQSPGATVALDELQGRLSEAETAKVTEEQNAAEREAEIERRRKRRTEVPGRLAVVRQQQEEVLRQLEGPLPEVGNPVAVAARRALVAKQRALERERSLLEREVAAYDATSRVLVAERDLATRHAAEARQRVAVLQTAVNERRRLEAREHAREARRILGSVHPSAKPLARELVDLADELLKARTVVSAGIAEASAALQRVERRTDGLVTEFDGLVERAERAGFTNALGLLLRTHRGNLPDLDTLREEIDARQEALSQRHIERIEYQNARRSGTDIETLVREAMERIGVVEDGEREKVENDVRAVVTARRRFLASAIEDENTLLDRLTALDTAQRVLVVRVTEQSDYVAEHILWVRSARPFGPSELAPMQGVVQWLSRGLPEFTARISDDVSANGVVYVVALLCFAALLPWQAHFRRRLRELGDEASRRTTTSMQPTLSALVLTVLISAFWPLSVGLFGWRFRELGSHGDVTYALGRALILGALLWFGLDVFRRACRPHGLGRRHFGWPEGPTSTVRTGLGTMLVFAVPPALVATLAHQSGVEGHVNSVGRLGLVVALLVTAWAAHYLLRPSGTVLEYAIGSDESSWLARTRYVWHPIGVGIPLGVAVLSLFGYHYTARQLTGRLVETILLVLGVLLVDALSKRWLLLAHRRLAIHRAREKREAAVADARAKESDEADGGIPEENLSAVLEDPAISLAASNAQIRVLFRAVFAVISVLGVWWIWSDVLPAFGILQRVQLWHSALPGAVVDGVETVRWVTLGSVLLALAIAVVTIVASRNLPGLLEFTVLSRLPLDAGARYAWSAVSGYAISVAGVVLVFRVLGFAWESVQWLVAAMTVGLGFGLQEIFANFVSGLIILFERPIRVGDTVTVGSVTGTVARIRIRATTIIDWDRKELIVPNREFVTGQLVNWTLSDPVLRVVCTVGVAYGSDTRLAKKLLLRIAADSPHVLDEPIANVIFWEFGDSTLNFELRIFVNTIHLFRTIKDEINTAIDDAFREHGIEIAFPQRDLHVRSVDGAIPLASVPPAPENGSLQERAEAVVARDQERSKPG